MGVRRIPGLIIAVSLAVAPLAFSRAVAADQPAVPAVDQTLAIYASTKDSVRLPDGRTIHFVCEGQGSPVVILTAGAGGWGVVWNKVQPQIAAKTRVCTWDRPGFGLSDMSPKPQTVDNTTTDLQGALKAGGIGGPYVLVGHSLGGLESLLLADRQPRDVVGMVLVDPSIPNQTARFKRAAPALYAGPAQDDPAAAFLRRCAAGLRAGTVHAGADPDGCLRGAPIPPEYPPELRAVVDKHPDRLPPETVAKAMDFLAAGSTLLDQDVLIAIKPDRNYGRMPLIILTAGQIPSPPNATAEQKAAYRSLGAEIRRGHDDLAALSTRGVNRMVSDSSHFIQQIKPQVVIDAIDEVVDEARGTDRK